jgi:tRNA-specific 2-thiouridylase
VGGRVVAVAHARDLERYRRSSFVIEQPHWIVGPPRRPELEVRVRHGPQLTRCRVEPAGSGVRVEMAEAEAGLAPGQYAVLYDDDECLGGGVISWDRRGPGQTGAENGDEDA